LGWRQETGGSFDVVFGSVWKQNIPPTCKKQHRSYDAQALEYAKTAMQDQKDPFSV